MLRCGAADGNECHAQWNLYFFQREDHEFETWVERIGNHPMVANAQRQKEKGPGGHLSTYNVGIRTRRNFSVLFGWTKNGDGQPRLGLGGTRLQMTHLWMTLTKDNQSGHEGERNLQLVANLLCDIARYDLPYPNVFGDDRLQLLKSAVGDSSGTSGTAVGAALSRPPLVVLVGHVDTPERSNEPIYALAEAAVGPSQAPDPDPSVAARLGVLVVFSEGGEPVLCQWRATRGRRCGPRPMASGRRRCRRRARMSSSTLGDSICKERDGVSANGDASKFM